MNTPAEIEQVLVDFAITTHILCALKVNPQIPADEVEVITKNGCVTLKGNLQWDFQIGIVTNMIKKISGVKGLTNHIGILRANDNISFWSFSAN